MADKTKTNIHERTEISKFLYRHSKIGISGRFPCDKNTELLYFQSYLELGVLRYLALDNTIKFMDSQTGTMKWLPRLSSRFRNYTPDMILVYKCGSITFVEVKPIWALDEAENERLHQIEVAFDRAGYGFKKITDEDVTYEMFVNAGHILQSPVHRFADGFLTIVANGISAALPRKFTFGQLKGYLAKFGLEICDYSLLKAGLFTFNMRELLTPDTLVWRAV